MDEWTNTGQPHNSPHTASLTYSGFLFIDIQATHHLSDL
jgi:hypothetical protein